MSEEFKLPGSSYDELVKIIIAYSKAKEGSLDELSKLCGIHITGISRNSGFLLAVGIVEGGKTKVITKKGNELARALQHNIAEEISRVWRDIVRESDFLYKMVTAIKIRKGMDVQGFQSHIAYSSGQQTNKHVRTGSATVVEILKVCGLITEVDGKLLPNDTDEICDIQTSEKDELRSVCDKSNLVTAPVKNFRTINKSDVVINIDVRITASVSELEGLGQKLRNLIEEIETDENDGAHK